MRKHKFLSVILCASIIFGGGNLPCSAEGKDSFSQLRENIKSFRLEGISSESICTNAKNSLETMNADGSWSDVDYGHIAGSEWKVAGHFSHIRNMTFAYYKEGQELYRDERLRHAVEKALSFAETGVFHDSAGNRSTRGGNWWYWNFSVPMNLGEALIFWQGNINEEIFSASKASVKWCLDNPLKWDLNGLYGNAANSIWACKGNLFYYTLDKNEEAVKFISSEFAKNFAVNYSPDEGINEDSSFRAHMMVDTNGYYQSFVGDALTFINGYFKDTAFQISEAALDNFAGSVYDGLLWMSYKGYTDISTRGRNYDGPWGKAAFLINAVKALSEIPNSRQQEFKEAYAKIQEGEEASLGQRYFWESDFAVHKNSKWYASLRTSSDKNIVSESFGGDGLKTTYIGDGAMWVITDGEEYYRNNMLATLNWDRLPGTTVAQGNPDFRHRSYIFANELFSGGCFNGEYGVNAFQLGKTHNTLRAKKSWFFFGDEIVCLGSDINYNGKGTPETIINQRPLENISSPVIVDGQQVSLSDGKPQTIKNPGWIQYEDIGYYFPNDIEVEVSKANQAGSWRILGASQSDAGYTNPFGTLAVPHSQNAKGEAYAYAVVPAKSKEEMEQYSAKKPIKIIRNDKLIQAVKNTETNTVGVIFWPKADTTLSTELNQLEKNNGLRPRAFDNLGSRLIRAKVKGINGYANFSPTYCSTRFAVNESRLGTSDVNVTVKWYDDGEAPMGAYWTLVYDSLSGQKFAEPVSYTYSGEWVETTLHLTDARFSETILGESGVEMAVTFPQIPLKFSKKVELDITSSAIVFNNNEIYGPLINSITISPFAPEAEDAAPYKTDIVEADKPCILMYKINDYKFYMTLSEPTNSETQVTITVDMALIPATENENISVKYENGRTAVTFNVKNGRSYNAIFDVAEYDGNMIMKIYRRILNVFNANCKK